MRGWPRTELLELLGLRHPILQAPMAGVATPEMAAAVTGAGGLGGIPAGSIDDAVLSADLAKARELAPGPYNVNLFMHPAPSTPSGEELSRAHAALAPLLSEAGIPPPAPLDPLPRSDGERLRTLLAIRPEVVSFHFGLPDDAALAALHDTGARLIASATTVEEAVELADRGMDAVIAQGAEAGGHRGGRGLIGTLALVPQVVDAIDVPVVAAGGIVDGRGVAAALALGAHGVQVGTALLRTPEASSSDEQRQLLARARAEDAILTRAVSGRPARGLRNRLVGAPEIDEAALEYPLQIALTRPLARRGDMRATWSGQGVPLARAEAASAAIERLAAEGLATLRDLGRDLD